MKFVDDKFAADAFLQGTTHVDALGHAWYSEQTYNGFSARTTETVKEFDTGLLGTQDDDALQSTDGDDDLEPVETTRGLPKAGIGNVGDSGVAGRAVLLDVGRALDSVSDDEDRLPLGYGITYEDLMETADAQGTQIRDRDILLVRTGAVERTRDPDAEWKPLDEPVIVYSDDLYEFVYERDIPYIGADNLAAEKVVQQIDATGDGKSETFVIPLHGAFLRDMGVQLNEILDLRELSAACAEDGVYEFLFTAAPLNVERATGSPVNPLVLKATGKGDGDEERGEDRRRLSSSPTARQTRSEMAAATSSSSSSEGSGGVPATA
jgi:kynurenine formamidase